MPTKTVLDVRRDNLRRLLEHKGARTALAEKLGCTQSYISQLLNPKTRGDIHEATARAIETAIGLEPGELDWPAGVRSAAPKTQPSGHGAFDGGPGDEALMAQTVRAVLTEFQNVKGKPLIEKVADIVTLAYKHNVLTGKCDDAHIAQLVRLMH